MAKTTKPLPPAGPRSRASQIPPLPADKHRLKPKHRTGAGQFKSPPSAEQFGNGPGDSDDFTADSPLSPGAIDAGFLGSDCDD